MERIFAAIGGGAIPGRDFSYAGLAAHGRNPRNVVLVVAKSHNDNAVVYEFVPGTAAAGPTVVPYWLSVEPSERASHLSRGNPSLISALNAAEELGFGCTVEEAPDGKGGARYFVSVNAAPLASRKFELLLDPEGTPFLAGAVGGKTARPTHAYIQMRRGLTGFAALGPRALEELRLYADDLETGEKVAERIAPPAGGVLN